MHRRLITALLALATALTLGACTAEEPSSQEREAQSRQGSYDRLTAAQPAQQMEYSPTRDTINFWIDTWDEPDKLSFIYLQAANGDLIGYYVLKGLPVSYCAALTPTYELLDAPGDGDDVPDFQVPAPGVDGAYYSGGQCNAYYGRDASTDTYLEFTLGSGMNMLVYEEPIPRQDVQPLGQATVEGVR